MAKNSAPVHVVRSAREVAIACNVTVRTVERWCEQGLVACRRTPTGQFRVDVDEHGWPLERSLED